MTLVSGEGLGKGRASRAVWTRNRTTRRESEFEFEFEFGKDPEVVVAWKRGVAVIDSRESGLRVSPRIRPADSSYTIENDLWPPADRQDFQSPFWLRRPRICRRTFNAARSPLNFFPEPELFRQEFWPILSSIFRVEYDLERTASLIAI